MFHQTICLTDKLWNPGVKVLDQFCAIKLYFVNAFYTYIGN